MSDVSEGVETSNQQVFNELKKSKKFVSKKVNIVFFILISFIPVVVFAVFLEGMGLPGFIGLIGFIIIPLGIYAWIKENAAKKAVLNRGASDIDAELNEKYHSYKMFFIVTLILWVLTIGAAIIIPGMSRPRIEAYNKTCIETLNEIAVAQKGYFNRKQTYTNEPKNLLGFTLPSGVAISELTADDKCWRASVFHDAGNERRTFTYDSCNGGLVSEEPELSEKK